MKIRFDEKGKYFTDVVTKTPLPATIQTQNHCIKGNIHLQPDERLKDALENAGNYIAVTGAVVFGPDGEELVRSEFLALNQRYIVWVKLDADTSNEGEPSGGES